MCFSKWLIITELFVSIFVSVLISRKSIKKTEVEPGISVFKKIASLSTLIGFDDLNLSLKEFPHL